MAANPRWACVAAILARISYAATIATRQGSTAISCASGRLFLRFSRIMTQRLTANPLSASTDTCPIVVEEHLRRLRVASRSQGPGWRRGDRRHRFHAYHERRELPAAEICARRAAHQQHDHPSYCRFPALAVRSRGHSRHRTMRDVFTGAAILLIAATHRQHPLLAYNIRNNVRLHRARFYAVNSKLANCIGKQRCSRRSPKTTEKLRSCNFYPEVEPRRRVGRRRYDDGITRHICATRFAARKIW